MGLASFKSLISSAAKFIDKAKRLAPRPVNKTLGVTGKKGKRRTAFANIIKIEKGPVCYRQVGIKWRHGEAVPLMQAYRKIRVLHATKGWRTYTNRVPGIGTIA